MWFAVIVVVTVVVTVSSKCAEDLKQTELETDKGKNLPGATRFLYGKRRG